jgi:hypothetical protein
MRAEQYQKNIALVERTVQEAAPEIANALLKAVTDGIPYEWLDVPMGRRQFYNARRKFFYLLDKAKG